MHWNLNSFRSKRDTLINELIPENNPMYICLNETKHHKKMI